MKAGGHNLEWHFPVQEAGGEEEGANEPGIGLFLNDRDSLPRETGQNIGDARLDESKPALARFEVLTLKASDIPGMESLARTVQLCKASINPSDRNANQFISNATRASQENEIRILRISDYNTTGLSGDDKSRREPFHRLIWTQGSANPHGAGGGTHGIGQRAPYAYSDLRAVFYSTMVENGEVAFIGKAILCGHESVQGFHRRVGYLGRRIEGKGNTTIRSSADIPSLFLRKERGTDINILGFNLPNWSDVFLEQILVNFFAAINKKAIEFEIAENGRVLHSVNVNTLSDYLERFKKSHLDTWHFYKALTAPLNGVPFVRDLGVIGDTQIGEAKFYVFKDAEANSEIARIRTPGILVSHRKNKILRGYSAVVEIDNKDGNAFLGSIEDPSHKKWEAGKHKDAPKVLKAINDFTKEVLEQLSDASRKDQEDIDDLADLLPDEGEIDTESNQVAKYSFPTGSGPRQGDEVQRDSEIFVSGASQVKSSDLQGSAPGQSAGVKVGPRKGGGKDLKARKGKAKFHFRGFPATQLSKDDYRVVIWSDDSWAGRVKLIAIGEDGLREELDILDAVDEVSGKKLSFSGSIISGLKVKKGAERVMKVTVKNVIPFKISIAAVEV